MNGATAFGLATGGGLHVTMQAPSWTVLAWWSSLGDNGMMVGTNARLAAAVEAYFADLRRVRASGGATGEQSSYGPLANLLNAVGAALKPKVFCVQGLADQGAAIPISASIRPNRFSGASRARGRRRNAAWSR